VQAFDDLIAEHVLGVEIVQAPHDLLVRHVPEIACPYAEDRGQFTGAEANLPFLRRRLRR
jgi:hypothetical protein